MNTCRQRQRIYHHAFRRARMNIVTDNFDIDRRGVEVFKLQFAYATTINSVSPAGIEGVNIKMFRPFAHFFIRGKGDANITMRNVFLLQYRQRGHDFCNTCFVIGT